MLLQTITEKLLYSYILNRITLEEDYQAVYTPTTTTNSEYLTKTIDGERIDINKLGMNSIKSTVSKWARF